MAQTVNQLTATQVKKLKSPGMYPDGAGLYLQVTGVGAKSSILRYSLRGRAREMGLGSFRKVSLAEARTKAADYHRLLDDLSIQLSIGDKNVARPRSKLPRPSLSEKRPRSTSLRTVPA